MRSRVKISLGLIFTLLMITFPQTSLAAGCDTLRSGQAALFQHGNYIGKCVVRDTSRYPSSAAIGIKGISSIKLGPRTQLTLCSGRNFNGHCKTYRKNTPSLGGMNDKTSSAIVMMIPPPNKAPPAKAPGRQSANCNPAANQAAFFQHSNYNGECAIRPIGRYASRSEIARFKISSIKLGPGTQLTLCSGNNFKGYCKTHRKNTPSLGGMNDNTSSAIAEKLSPITKDTSHCAPNDNQATVYEHVNYKGACSILDIGNYQNSSGMGIANDAISSIKVGKNVALVGFEHVNFRAVTFYTEKDKPRMLSKSKSGIQELGQGDKISSLKVMRRNK